MKKKSRASASPAKRAKATKRPAERTKAAKRAKPSKRPAKKPVSDATRAADEALREELRHADLTKFDQVLAKAIRPAR